MQLVPSCGGVVPRGELAPRLVGGLRRDDGVLVLIERPDRLLFNQKRAKKTRQRRSIESKERKKLRAGCVLFVSSYLRFHSAKFKVRELEKSREKNLHPHRPSSGTLRPDDFHRLRLHRLHGAGDDVALRWLFTRRHGWLKVSIEHPPGRRYIFK